MNPWWRQLIGRGVQRSRVDVFVDYWLEAQTGTSVAVRRVFREFQHYMDRRDDRLEETMEQLLDDARYFMESETHAPLGLLGERESVAERRGHNPGCLAAESRVVRTTPGAGRLGEEPDPIDGGQPEGSRRPPRGTPLAPRVGAGRVAVAERDRPGAGRGGAKSGARHAREPDSAKRATEFVRQQQGVDREAREDTEVRQPVLEPAAP